MSKFSILQVGLTLLFLAGGLSLGLWFLGVLSADVVVDGEVWKYGVLTVGSMVGGFFAARVSTRSNVIETGIASVILCLFYYIFVTKMAAVEERALNASVLVVALRLGVPTVVGALVGASLGWKHHHRFRATRDSSQWRWVGISTMIAMGSLTWYTVVVLLGFGELSDERTTAFVLGCCVVLLIAGGVTQWIAPLPNHPACGAGGAGIIVITMVGILILEQASMTTAIIGGGILAILVMGIGALGAKIAYKISGRTAAEDEQRFAASEVPVASAVIAQD